MHREFEIVPLFLKNKEDDSIYIHGTQIKAVDYRDKTLFKLIMANPDMLNDQNE